MQGAIGSAGALKHPQTKTGPTVVEPIDGSPPVHAVPFPLIAERIDGYHLSSTLERPILSPNIRMTR